MDSNNNLDFNAAGLTQATLGSVGSVTYGGTLTAAGAVFRLGGGNGSLTLTSHLLGPARLLINPGSSAGVVTLDAANAYSGTTEVVGGTLLIGDANSVSASIAGTVSVDSGATLGGHGTINGNVANGGNLRPGGTIGVLTVSGNSPGEYWHTNHRDPNAAAGPGIGYDQLAVGGTASLNGALSVLGDGDPTGLAPAIQLLTAAGGRTGSFVSVLQSDLRRLHFPSGQLRRQ